MNSGLMVFILFLSHRESLILREIYEQRQFKKKHQLIGILKSLHIPSKLDPYIHASLFPILLEQPEQQCHLPVCSRQLGFTWNRTDFV